MTTVAPLVTGLASWTEPLVRGDGATSERLWTFWFRDVVFMHPTSGPLLD